MCLMEQLTRICEHVSNGTIDFLVVTEQGPEGSY